MNICDIEKLESVLGYHYRDQEFLITALTHSSYANENKSKSEEDIICNERLEFLGDSILSIIVSDYLYKNFNDSQEGDLTKVRASLVCEKSLSKFANKIELGQFLRLGHGEEKGGGRNRPSILADAFEALLASIYLDSGEDGIANVRTFLMPFITEEIVKLDTSDTYTDYKTALQQIIQQVEGEKLVYVLVAESGPDHCKRFSIEARLNSNVIGCGEGRSKREAEQMAAKEALKLFGV